MYITQSPKEKVKELVADSCGSMSGRIQKAGKGRMKFSQHWPSNGLNFVPIC